MWPTVSAPAGYLICNGSTYSSATYPSLFAVLGSTTLPDFRDKFARGYSSTSGRTILDTQ
jgi:microcystin-dependent protein